MRADNSTFVIAAARRRSQATRRRAVAMTKVELSARIGHLLSAVL
jgi:hypothetical protein